MCGRYRLSCSKHVIAEHFGLAIEVEADGAAAPWTPRYNIAPTQPVPIICQHPEEPLREWSLHNLRKESDIATGGHCGLKPD